MPQHQTSDDHAAALVTLSADVDAFFCPSGGFEQGCARASFPYEPRPQQRQMAESVAAALTDGEHLVAEAGTGVGKSFAYLVPLMLASLKTGVPAVVSTYTISLQEQLLEKDIPFLERHLGLDEFRAVLVKGRNNYLCMRRLARAEKRGPDLFTKDLEKELHTIREWSRNTADGSRSDFERQPPRALWSRVCAEHGNCLGRRCPDFKRCFFMRARSRIFGANLLVLNHHLFFSELALRAEGAPFLPNYHAVVFDEAHCIESVASEHLGLRLAQYGVESWLRRLYDSGSSRGLLRVLQAGAAAKLVDETAEAAAVFFDEIRNWTEFDPRKRQRVADQPLAMKTTLPERLGTLNRALADLVGSTEDPDLGAEIQAALQRGAEMRDALGAFLQQSLDDQVYWTECEGGRRRSCTLRSAPIEVGPVLQARIFGQTRCAVMTSATLAVTGKLDYFRNRVGADPSRVLYVGSPFDYERQMRLYVARDMPDPNDTNAFPPQCATLVQRLVNMTNGSAFVLFTNLKLMHEIAVLCEDEFQAKQRPFLVQGKGMPRNVMLDAFRKRTGSVLFGLDSFWMGVDVRGDALRNVIITRLPFAVPDQPVIKARMDRVKSRGGDPFKEYSLPEAILKFRQGVGRLIRAGTDEGIIAILDPRIASRWYGRLFIQSIPTCPIETMDL